MNRNNIVNKRISSSIPCFRLDDWVTSLWSDEKMTIFFDWWNSEWLDETSTKNQAYFSDSRNVRRSIASQTTFEIFAKLAPSITHFDPYLKSGLRRNTAPYISRIRKIGLIFGTSFIQSFWVSSNSKLSHTCSPDHGLYGVYHNMTKKVIKLFIHMISCLYEIICFFQINMFFVHFHHFEFKLKLIN